MDMAARLGGYATVLAIAFGAAWAVGAAVGPLPAPAAAPAARATAPPDDGTAGMSGMDMGGTPGMDHSAGTDALSTTSSGYSLVPRDPTYAAGRPGELAFTVTGSDGRPVPLDPGMRVAVVRRD